MKLCGACCNELSEDRFSKKQWKLKQYQRRCKVCVDSNRDIPRQEPKQPKKKKGDEHLAGLEGFERLQAVGNALGSTIMRGPGPSPSDAWDHLLPDEQELMKKWEKSMPPHMLVDGYPTKSGSMKVLGISPAMVKGIPIGNWHLLITQRIMKADAPVNYANSPPLMEGDRVEVLPGNSVKREMVGQKGRIMDYFEDDDKWGIDIEGGQPSLVMAGNLKRIDDDDSIVYDSDMWERNWTWKQPI